MCEDTVCGKSVTVFTVVAGQVSPGDPDPVYLDVIDLTIVSLLSAHSISSFFFRRKEIWRWSNQRPPWFDLHSSKRSSLQPILRTSLCWWSVELRYVHNPPPISSSAHVLNTTILDVHSKRLTNVICKYSGKPSVSKSIHSQYIVVFEKLTICSYILKHTSLYMVVVLKTPYFTCSF